MQISLKEYPRPARRHQQAHQLWPILTGWTVLRVVGRLEKKGLITYGEAAKHMGYNPQAGRTLAQSLGLISRFCSEMNIPHLNAIVVDYETGEPGFGIPYKHGVSDEEMRRRVAEFNWFKYRQPTLRNFRDLQSIKKNNLIDE